MSSRGDRRRAEVVAAARKLVAEGGLEAMTFAALERVLPFTRGVITWHFADKRELLEAVLDSAAADIDAETAAEVHPEEPFACQVEAVLGSKIRGFLLHLEATRVLVAFWSDPSAPAPTGALFERWRRQGAALLRAAIARGEADPGVDPDDYGGLLVALVTGVVVQATYAGPVDVPRATKIAVDAALGAVWRR